MSNEFSISYFKQNLKTLSNLNRYRIFINNKYFQDLTNHSIFAKEVTIPGQSLNVTSITIQGQLRNIPMNMDYDPISITFICDSKLKSYKAVQQWMDELIYNKKKKYVNFLDDFKCNIYIEPLTRKNEKTIKYEIQDAWPKEIGDISMGYDNEGPFEFNCTFNFFAWEIID